MRHIIIIRASQGRMFGGFRGNRSCGVERAHLSNSRPRHMTPWECAPDSDPPQIDQPAPNLCPEQIKGIFLSLLSHLPPFVKTDVSVVVQVHVAEEVVQPAV